MKKSNFVFWVISNLLTVVKLSLQDNLISKVDVQHCFANEKDNCQGSGGPFDIQLLTWFDELSDKAKEFNCELSFDENFSVDPIYEITNCDDQNAVWKYKYTGGKGSKKIFRGKGTLSFINSDISPHGYNYGMKSGICIKIDEEIKNIEGTFDEKGILHGQAIVSLHNKTTYYGNFHKGILHGLVRTFDVDIDPETNRELPEKRLTVATTFRNGQQVGPVWKFPNQRIVSLVKNNPPDLVFVKYQKLNIHQRINMTRDFLLEHDEKEQEFLKQTMNFTEMFPQDFLIDNGEAEKKSFQETLFGSVDKDNTVLKAQRAQIVAVKDELCVINVEGDASGEIFDYDIETGSTSGVFSAKISHFFDKIADLSISFETIFKPLESAIDTDALQIYSKLKLVNSTDCYQLETPYHEQGILKVIYDGERNKGGKFHGKGSFKALYEPEVVLPGIHGYSDEFADRFVETIAGRFEDDKFVGPVKIKFTDSSYIEGFAVNNVFHGPYRKVTTGYSIRNARRRYNSRNLEKSKRKEAANNFAGSTSTRLEELTSLGLFKNGRQDGPLWRFLSSSTFSFGFIKNDKSPFDNFYSEQGAFISSDLMSAYFGHFSQDTLVKAQTAKVVGQEVVEQIRVPKISQPEGQVYQFVKISERGNPEQLIPDPLEDEQVYVNVSTIYPSVKGQYPHLGDGLFAKKPISSGSIIAFFGGELIPLEEWIDMKMYAPHYSLIVGKNVVYLPEKLGKDLTKFRASLGHKINHSFSKSNCQFTDKYHPRFGVIPTAIATVNIEAHSEIVCNYNLEFQVSPPWYQELWRKEIDLDDVEGTIGERGQKKSPGEPIEPMLVDDLVYKSFLEYAINDLKLKTSA